MVELYSNDVVAATSSKGDQEKWYAALSATWYKLDSGAFEAMAETVASAIMLHSNIESELGYEVVEYRIETVTVHRRKHIACASKNFLQPDEEIVTLARLLKAELGDDYQRIFRSRKSVEKRLKTLVDAVADITGLDDFGRYLTLLFEMDALILNEDRHLNNIAVLYGPSGYKYCPLFDNGAGFMLDQALYPFDVETSGLISLPKAKPFRCAFSTQVRAARNLYGCQLRIDYAPEQLLNVIEDSVQAYPKPFQPLLRDRVYDVVTHQRKRLVL